MPNEANPTNLPKNTTFGPITQTDVVRFAGAGGDFNPLHHDAATAEAAGYSRPIAMGQFTAALMAGWITDWCGIEHLRRLEVSFRAPMFIGDVVIFAVDSSQPADSADQDGLLLTLSAKVQDRLVVSGHVHVRREISGSKARSNA